MNTSSDFCTKCGQPLDAATGTCLPCTEKPADRKPNGKAGGYLRRHAVAIGLIPWFFLLLYLGYAKSPYFKTAAIVNDHRITVSEVEQEATRMASRMETEGSKPTEEFMDQLRARALQTLINQAIIES